MRNVVLHKDGTVSYRTPLSGRWIRRVDLPCAVELVLLTPAEQCRILDHLWTDLWRRRGLLSNTSQQRLGELRALERCRSR